MHLQNQISTLKELRLNRNLWRASLSKKVRAILATIALVLGLGVSSAVMATPASAATTLCSGNSYSTCISAGYTDHDFASHYTSSYWGAFAGHNCTNYVAYMESTVNGAPSPGNNLGNAYQWGPNARNKGYVVDSTPGIGSVAWWDRSSGGSSSDGHVAYVEAINSTNGSIRVSEDVYSSGPFRWRDIAPGDAQWPTGFIHFKDLSGGTGGVTNPPANPSNANLLLARQGGNLFGKADLADAWTALASNATGGMWASGNRIAYLSSGTLYAKNGLGGTWMNESSNVDEVALSNDLLVIRKGATIYAKGGLDTSWVIIATDAIDVKVAGTKILHRNAAHTLFSNDGMYGSWYNEGNNVDQFDASGNILVKRVGSYAYAKTSLGASWTEVSAVASNVQVGGTRIAVTSTQDGHVWAKDGVSGTWLNEESAGDEYIITPTTLLIRQGNTVIAKSGLGDAWITLATTATNVEASGSRIAVVNSSGDLAARNDLPTGWYNVLDGVTEFTVGT